MHPWRIMYKVTYQTTTVYVLTAVRNPTNVNYPNFCWIRSSHCGTYKAYSSSGMSRRVDPVKSTDVSEERTLSIFKVDE
jgi:hypothetical protein